MDANTILKIFEPMLTDGLTRLRSRNRKVDNRDVVTIFGPIVQSIARAAGGNPGDAVAGLADTWEPADTNMGRLEGLVRAIVKAAAPPIDFEAMRRKQEELEAELAAPMRSLDRPNVGETLVY